MGKYTKRFEQGIIIPIVNKEDKMGPLPPVDMCSELCMILEGFKKG